MSSPSYHQEYSTRMTSMLTADGYRSSTLGMSSVNAGGRNTSHSSKNVSDGPRLEGTSVLVNCWLWTTRHPEIHGHLEGLWRLFRTRKAFFVRWKSRTATTSFVARWQNYVFFKNLMIIDGLFWTQAFMGMGEDDDGLKPKASTRFRWIQRKARKFV